MIVCAGTERRQESPVSHVRSVRTRLTLCLLLVLSACFTIDLAAEDSGPRIALVIGNGAYESSPLKNPANDAADVDAALKELGFEVTTLIDANRTKMERAIRDFGAALKDGGAGLFYYAGHGVQIKGRNYLIPVGEDIQEADEVAYKAVDAELVLAKMESAGNSTNIIILDACRNNPFPGAERATSRGLAVVGVQPAGSYIVFATQPNATAQDNPSDRNGLFTQNLLKHIRTPGLDIDIMVRRVRDEVRKATNGGQVPWSNSSLGSAGFVFAALPKAVAPPPAPAPPPPAPALSLAPSFTVEKAYGSITIAAKTAGTLVMNGTPLGDLGANASARLDGIEVGIVKLEMRYPEGNAETLEVQVGKDAPAVASFVYAKPAPAPAPTLVAAAAAVPAAAAEGAGAPPAAAQEAAAAGPAKDTGTLTLASDPPGIDVEIDEKTIVKTPAAVELAPGSHSIQTLRSLVGNRYYLEQPKQWVAVTAGVSLSVPIKPEAGTANLSFHLVPEGYAVFIDDEKAGVTPLGQLHVKAGQLAIRFERAGEPPKFFARHALPGEESRIVWGTTPDAPIQLERRKIALSAKPDSWAGIEPILDEPTLGTGRFMGQQEFSMVRLYVCRDDGYLYWRIDFDETNPFWKAPKGIKEAVACQLSIEFERGKRLNLGFNHNLQKNRTDSWMGIWDGKWTHLADNVVASSKGTGMLVARIAWINVRKYLTGAHALTVDLANAGSNGWESFGQQHTPPRYIDFSK